jgi:hypothetical protein
LAEDDERIFTLGEAQALLPELKRRIAVLRTLKRSMEQKAAHISALAEKSRESSGSATGTRYVRELMDFQRELREIAETGCVLRDVDRGLLDFPAIRSGRKIFLCWAWGEESIGWWHDEDTGFAGRQPLER